MSAFAFFEYNMLVQAGSPVKIKGLQSEAGQKLNGKTGVALEFYPAEGRWKVKVEDADGSSPQVMKKIRIQNLEWNGDRKSLIECSLAEEEGLEGRVVAGTTSGRLALGCCIPLTRMDEMKDEINKQFLLMGVPSTMWLGSPEPFNPLKKGIKSMFKRCGHNFFVSTGGGQSQGPLEELGIELGLVGSCVRCGNAASKTCIGCNASYCGKECQKSSWKDGHKEECVKTRREKVVAAWTSYDDKLQEHDRPDGEVKPLVRRDKYGRNAAWDPIIETRIFFDGENGPVDTGLVVRHRIKMDDDGDSLVAVMGGKFGDEESTTLQNIERLKRKMVGTPFYEQPFMTTELYKLLEKGKLLGEKLPLTQAEAHRELKAIAGRDVNLNLDYVPSDHYDAAAAYFENGVVYFADVVCKDGFFVKTYFNNVYIESHGSVHD